MWEMVVNHAENADVVVVPSDHFGRKIEHYGVSRPIIVVSNGIPEELVAEDFAPRTMKDGDVLKIVWNCRVSREKRIIPLLKALRMLKRPYILHVYGSGNALKAAKRYAEKYKLKVKFYGETDRKKIVKRMQESHLGATVSYNFDVQAMTLLEAEATGLPTFFCDPDMIEIVPQGGFLIAGGCEPEAMAIALERMPAEQIEKMSKVMLKNREKVLQSAQIKDLLKAYRRAKSEHEARKLAEK